MANGNNQDGKPGNPNLDSTGERIRYAVRKKYIEDEDYTNKEIADDLNIATPMVSRYLNQTPYGEHVQKARDAIEKEEWRQLLLDLKERLDKLSELERQLWDVVEPVVSSYELVPADAHIEEYHLQENGNSLELDLAPGDDDKGIEREVEVPIPSDWKEIPEFSRLRSVWDERRRTEEQLTNLLGLDAEDEIAVKGDVTQRKVFEVDDSEYPEPDETPAGGGDHAASTDEGDSPDQTSLDESAYDESTDEDSKSKSTEESEKGDMNESDAEEE